MGACLSNIDETVMVNSINSALLSLILNNSLFNFLKQIGIEDLIVSAVNDFWFLFLLKTFQNFNYHFAKM